LISVTVEDVKGMDNFVRCDCIPLLVINTCLRPLEPNEPIPRKIIEAMNRLHLEGLLQKMKTILGWHIYFCQLLIKLLNNKFVAWTAAIEKMMGDGHQPQRLSKQTLDVLSILASISVYSSLHEPTL
jgi:hypothetical protein